MIHCSDVVLGISASWCKLLGWSSVLVYVADCEHWASLVSYGGLALAVWLTYSRIDDVATGLTPHATDPALGMTYRDLVPFDALTEWCCVYPEVTADMSVVSYVSDFAVAGTGDHGKFGNHPVW